MRFLSTLVSGAVLATLAAAVPQEQPAPQVTIYNDIDFQGEGVGFTPDETCHTISPSIKSVGIPDDADIYCQLFDNKGCEGEGGELTISSLPDFGATDYYGIICGVFQ